MLLERLLRGERRAPCRVVLEGPVDRRGITETFVADRLAESVGVVPEKLEVDHRSGVGRAKLAAVWPPACDDADETSTFAKPPTRSDMSLRFSILALLLTAGCGGTSPLVEALAGTTWTVDRIVISDSEVRRGEGETVTFGEGGAVSIASCNQCTGSLRASADGLVIPGTLACTKRACGPGVLELEALLTDRTLRRDGIYLIADGPSSVGAVGTAQSAPTVVLVQAP